ncbi:MAG: GTPase HflX [Oscillospiraceae bacterium]|nr:GTPase HflX [Oscillospiraceae bacterium]
MGKINGNTKGLRRSSIEQLEKIYDMETERKQFCTPEMIEALADFTEATGREAMVYLDRSGRVVTVAAGEHDRVKLPALNLRRSQFRLCGIRCIHTHPKGSNLSDKDLQTLKSLRLDAIAAVGISGGKPVAIQVGVLDTMTPDNEFTVNLFGPFNIDVIPDDELWAEIRSADVRIRPAESQKAGAEIARAILIGIDGNQESGESPCALCELSQLANTAGFIIAGHMVQPRIKPDNSYYFGYGKLQDLIFKIEALNADAVIFDDELTPAQIRNIQKELGKKIELIDRTALILDIFSSRASTHEGRLQVELAQTKYLLPRMMGFWTHLSRMGGGGGSGKGARRGEGETQLEADRRILRKRLNELEKEIDKIKSRRNVQRSARERSNIPVIAIVGYTNAGKSTLLNTLSGSNVLAEDKLFATLDPVSRRVNFGSGDFLLVDTVGFINKLPHDLVDAFRATLEETQYADLILHIVDASSETQTQQMEVVGEVLTRLGVNNKPILTVYNKCDLSNNPGPLRHNENYVDVSAKTGTGIANLKNAISQKLSEARCEISVLLPLDAGALVSRIYTVGQVTGCEYLTDGIYLNAVVTLEDSARLCASATKIYMGER